MYCNSGHMCKFSFRNAQLAKQHAPAAKLDATAKPGEKMGGTLRGSGPAKPAGKEKASGESSITRFFYRAHEHINSQHMLVLTESHDSWPSPDPMLVCHMHAQELEAPSMHIPF